MLDGVAHVVRDHERGQASLGDDLVAEHEHACRGAGGERCRVLVEQQQPGLDQRGHEQRERLALSAGEQTRAGGHAVFKAETEAGELVAVVRALGALDAPGQGAAAAAARGQGEVLLDGHGRSRAQHRILEHAAYHGGALVLALAGDVHAVDAYAPAVNLEGSGYGVEHGALAGAVAAYDRDKVAVIQAKVEAAERSLGIYSTGVEGLGDVFKL